MGTGVHRAPSLPAEEQRSPGSGRGLGGQAWGGGGGQQGEAYFGFAALQPVVKEGVIGTADVGGKGVLPDCGVWGLVQVGQVLKGALAEALQGYGNRW